MILDVNIHSCQLTIVHELITNTSFLILIQKINLIHAIIILDKLSRILKCKLVR